MGTGRTFVASAFLILAVVAPMQTAEPEQAPVFVSGRDGYHTYRIPSLLVTKKGTLLAFCEGRKKDSSDAGDIDLLLKRSFDGGKTWAKTQVVWDDGANTCGNPCPVLDARTATIWLLLTHNLGRDTQTRIVNGTSKGTRTVWVARSDDDGATWSKPVEITRSVKKPDWTWYATGPGVGIQLKNGRLVVPCDNQVAGSKVQQSHVIVSDDGGKTWRLGGVVGPQCNESQVVELRDGSLLLNIRSYRGDNRRLVAISKDGGETFSKPVPDKQLIEPVCQASILRHPGARGGLLFSNPASTKRETMTVRLSRDEGKTWPHAEVLHDGPSAYSCLAVLPDGAIACLYERGLKTPYETMTLARLSLDWLAADKRDARKRRLLYNLDGDSCLFLKKGSRNPEPIAADDLKAIVHEITQPGSQVDTLLICVNAQVMYYPTRVGTLRGKDCTPEERRKWPASEQQRAKNVQAMFDAGTDPYAVLLAEARKRGLEALLTFRVNDAHGNDFLRTAFWREHPEFRLGKGALDFKHEAVREYVFHLIEEAVRRYDCDGLELDFQRFPTLFQDGTTPERVAKINSLIKRIRKMLDAEGKKRGRRLVLAARIPSDYGRSAPSYDTARSIGCDPVTWAKNGWVDFLTVSEFLHVRYDLPLKPWKRLIPNIPIYGSIECAEGGRREQCLTPEKYRRAARHLWADGADGVYLFNFFTTREGGKDAFEPPFEVLNDIGDPDTIRPPFRVESGVRQLFLDDRLIASSQGLRRVWHSAKKFPGNPVLQRDKPWEGSGPYTYGTVLFDAEARTFKLWYNCYVGKRPDYWVCYATSSDGIHWHRPALNVVSDPRLRPGNNVVLLGSGLPEYRQCLSPSVLYRPQERDPQRRYALLYWDTNAGRTLRFLGLCLAFSPDGIHWTNVRNNPVFDGCSDVTDACYDAARDRYLLHYKMWRVEGQPVASAGTDVRVGEVSYWCGWDEVPLAGDKVRFRGKLVHYTATASKVVTAAVDYARPPSYRRVVTRAESADLVHWAKARPVLELPQQGDPPGLSTYGMSVFPYEGRYLGLLRVFHNEREIDLHLAYSDDDLTWRRAPGRMPFLGLGRGGSHDAGMVFSTNGSVVVGDELWFYYGAFTGNHAQADDRQHASIGLAKLRRDGFVSLDAGKEAGELVTVPFRMDGDRLLLNAAAKEGELRIEVRDERGQPRRGFSFEDCKPFRGDAVSHTVAWRDGESLSSLKGQIVQLVFRVRQARLYAFQVGTGRAK